MLLLALVLAMVVSLAGCGGAKKEESAAAPQANTQAAPVQEEKKTEKEPAQIKIRIASSGTTAEYSGEGTTVLGVSVNYFIKEIEERSNGRITAKVFPDGQLASSAQEYIGGLQSGSFDICVMNNGSWSDYTPAFAGLNIPYLYFDYEVAHAVLDSDIGESWKQKVFEDTGVLPLAYFDIGFRQLTANSAVRTPDDLKGIKIRTMVDNVQMACWEALGAAVTPVAYSELYTALQQKLVDAQENPPSNIVASKLYELQDYMMLTNHNYTATIAAASPVFWGKLSQEDQDLVKSVMIDAQNEGRKHTAEFEAKFIETIAASGTEVVQLTTEELSAFQDKAKTVWPMVAQEMGEEAYTQLTEFVENYYKK